jgi:hypothetical protein
LGLAPSLEGLKAFGCSARTSTAQLYSIPDTIERIGRWPNSAIAFLLINNSLQVRSRFYRVSETAGGRYSTCCSRPPSPPSPPSPRPMDTRQGLLRWLPAIGDYEVGSTSYVSFVRCKRASFSWRDGDLVVSNGCTTTYAYSPVRYNMKSTSVPKARTYYRLA